MNNRLFMIARDDWSLHRKGEIDQERHKRKVKEAIRHNLADLVSEESIIMPQGDKVIKVPIRSLDEPKFRYNYQNEPQVGQGQGGTQVGDVIGQAGPDGAEGPGKGGHEAGDQPGEDYYEAELTIDELAEMVFEDLKLPRLKPKAAPELTIEDVRFDDVRKQGMMSNVDKRRTLFEAIKRQALGGGQSMPHAAAVRSDWTPPPEPQHVSSGSVLGPITGDDLRYKTWEDIRKPQSSAVVLAMMDTSGSMGTFEKYVARSFFFWMTRFLRTKYENVQIRFLSHSTDAKEVDEESFFHKGESGGTKCSSVYELALRILEADYPPAQHNAYAFHFSDGDNLNSDNPATVRLAGELLERVNMLGYGEIRQHVYGSKQLWESMSGIASPSFSRSILKEKEDVFKTLQAFFGEELAS
ncbi:sporulation protein YhbH [Paenibacillus sp. S150]|uniref:sporulation protein YhbH n=1 Tax=Paenibacillus sp. S150 TaxID=2749826 RepID=UPI001C5685DF|nr:sporulation protein YhbH [Paenibacillus sp. S150]MBW4085626.1 sporulation protein YhbH [Paenibacillus sp. S150]